MSIKSGLKVFCAVLVACLALQVPTKGSAQNAGGSVLAPSLILKPADLTPKELEYYNKISDPVVAKNFIITRSYVRICQNINDNKFPADKLPGKPTGFSARYTFEGDVDIVTDAVAKSVTAKICGNSDICSGGK